MRLRVGSDFHPAPGMLTKITAVKLNMLHLFPFITSLLVLCLCELSKSPSVVSDSLWPHGLNGIHQARVLEWVAFPFSRGSSQPRDWTQVSCIVGRFFTSWTTREALSPEGPQTVSKWWKKRSTLEKNHKTKLSSLWHISQPDSGKGRGFKLEGSFQFHYFPGLDFYPFLDRF